MSAFGRIVSKGSTCSDDENDESRRTLTDLGTSGARRLGDGTEEIKTERGLLGVTSRLIGVVRPERRIRKGTRTKEGSGERWVSVQVPS